VKGVSLFSLREHDIAAVRASFARRGGTLELDDLADVRSATHCTTLRHTATTLSNLMISLMYALQHTAPHCTTLQQHSRT